MEPDEVAPRTHLISRPIVDENGESKAYLSIIEYHNALQASIYDKRPSLGSMTMAYPVMSAVERHAIFTGKHDQLSSALAMILSRATGKIVYASVNIKEHATVTTAMIKDMIAEFTDRLEQPDNQPGHVEDRSEMQSDSSREII